ncbi:hypothetical protein JD490_18165 [Aeromonas dhakensis]|uniref:hypothetical protein n=1 Tax=Aeromonas dhakensis TaxID=196024 RepID=UPI00191F8E58|nr:hypothetical protein [Aeromonas dhakensis]MBL0526823.1 hypothetical protein [Aeromonas dhakensis]
MEIRLNIPTVHIDPSIRSQDSGDTRQLALVQTASARQVLYEPGTTLSHELSQAANKLYQVYESLDQGDQAALGARLFGAEGLMPHATPSDLLQVLNRVDQMPSHASGHDRSIVIALMGDIGALYAATGATTGTERSQEASVRLRDGLAQALVNAGLTPPSGGSIQEVQERGGSSAVGPDKKAERSRPQAEHVFRTGIHNLGEEADDLLDVPRDSRIPPTKWDVAHISAQRVAETIEPFAGHMSGSPAEILQTWDMLRGEAPEQQFVGRLHSEHQYDPMQNRTPAEQEQLRARAAGAGAFLVGLGYHSSVEVIEGTLTYMGQSLRDHNVLGIGQRDAGHLFGAGAATDLMSELFQSHCR